MLFFLLGKLNGASIDLVDNAANKLGFGTILTSIGLTVSQEVSAQTTIEQVLSAPWALTDYALMISGIGGVLFIIEKLIVIYIRIRQAKRLERAEHKSRGLPK